MKQGKSEANLDRKTEKLTDIRCFATSGFRFIGFHKLISLIIRINILPYYYTLIRNKNQYFQSIFFAFEEYFLMEVRNELYLGVYDCNFLCVFFF